MTSGVRGLELDKSFEKTGTLHVNEPALKTCSGDSAKHQLNTGLWLLLLLSCRVSLPAAGWSAQAG